MERLTEHHVNKTMGVYMVCSGACDDFNCTDCEKFNEIVDRLAAYEDTGLAPVEITTRRTACVFYCNRQCNLNGDFCIEGPGCPLELNAENAMRLLPKLFNDPLTLDELREMDGEPVWCVDGRGNACWCLVNCDDGLPCCYDNETGLWEDCFYGMADNEQHGLHQYGWLAYRRKPEEETC